MSDRLQPTPYPDVNAVLGEFRARIHGILGDHLRGMYLDGSLALGDFNPHTSDIDFVVTTDGELSDAQFVALRTMHARFNASGSPWATEVEAVYLPETIFRGSDPARVQHLRIERGDEVLVKGHSDSTWIIHWSIVRDHGVALAGPDPRTLIGPIDPRDLRRATAALGEAWLAAAHQEHDALQHRGYVTYLVLTLCRMLYTLSSGVVVSKPVAARWARQALAERWSPLVERALSWRKDPAPQEAVSLEERRATLALIGYTLERCRYLEQSPPQEEPC